MVLTHPITKFLLSVLILKVRRASRPFQPSFFALEDAGGSRLGFGITIIFWILSMVFDSPMFQIFALCLDFESAKDITVLSVLTWGFRGCWRFLTGVGDVDHDS